MSLGPVYVICMATSRDTWRYRGNESCKAQGKSLSSLHAAKATKASSKCAMLNSQAYDRDWNVVTSSMHRR